MNKRDLDILKLGSENPKALGVLLKISGLLEKQPVVAISQDDLAQDLGMSSKAVSQVLDNLSDLVHASRSGNSWIFSSREIVWKEQGEYEVLKVSILRKKNAVSGQSQTPAPESKPAAAPEKASPAAPAAGGHK